MFKTGSKEFEKRNVRNENDLKQNGSFSIDKV